MALLDSFLSLSLWIRVGLVLLTTVVLLLLLRIPLLKVLSLIPFLIRQLFRAVYLLLEWLVSVLHKLLGGMFYRIDNGLAALGGRVDSWLSRWFGAWNKPQSWKRYAAVVAVAAAACYLFVIVPPALHMDDGDWQNRGQSIYLRTEGAFIDWLEDSGWYIPTAPANDLPSAQPTVGEPELPQEPIQVLLTVYRVPNVLAIRNIPSTQESTTLDTLPNGAVVSWNGELAFGFAEGRQEAWVKVTTETGAEGWGRLNYLHPEENVELTLVLADAPETAAPIPPIE